MKIHIIYIDIFNIKLLTFTIAKKILQVSEDIGKLGVTGFVQTRQIFFCADRVCLMSKNHADDYSWYAWVIAIHLGSTGNHVPRISANIRYVTTEVVKQFNVSKEICFPFQVILRVGSGKSQFEFPLIFCKIVFIEPDLIV